jgi:hypothetical protein
VRQRVREKNQVHAALQRQLKVRPPMTDAFGVKGRVWLSDQCRLLPVNERRTVDACLRQIDFLEREIELVDVEIAKQVLASEDIRRLMTLPGVSGVTTGSPADSSSGPPQLWRLRLSGASADTPMRRFASTAPGQQLGVRRPDSRDEDRDAAGDYYCAC